MWISLQCRNLWDECPRDMYVFFNFIAWMKKSLLETLSPSIFVSYPNFHSNVNCIRVVCSIRIQRSHHSCAPLLCWTSDNSCRPSDNTPWPTQFRALLSDEFHEATQGREYHSGSLGHKIRESHRLKLLGIGTIWFPWYHHIWNCLSGSHVTL